MGKISLSHSFSLPQKVALLSTDQRFAASAMTPSKADAALNNTLEDVQLVIKRCMKLKEGNSAVRIVLLDEITRCVAKDLKLYAGHATSFSPQLLSCAAIIWQYCKAGIFQALRDWTTVIDNDLCIKQHPRFHKMVNYCHVTTIGVMEPIASGLVDEQATSPVLDTRLFCWIYQAVGTSIAHFGPANINQISDSHLDQLMEAVTLHPDTLAPPAMQPLETMLPPTMAQPITNPMVGSGGL
ncbi:hypothetical protein BDR06DRAFT_971885 [Suillus hirtellus]|nr:hypothetical protein BDR06DRAFT_971885 [Suillus hirtellus]